MKSTSRTTRKSSGLTRLLAIGLLVVGWGFALQPAHAIHSCGDGVLDYDEVCDDGNLIDGDGCNSICQLEEFSCIDDVTGVTNNCTANDVRLALVINAGGDLFCEAGETVDVTLIAELEATAAERWDIGIFIALDGGTARVGSCYQDFLDGVDPALQPTLPTCEGVCDISGNACFKDEDCPDFATGEVCTGGYNPGTLTVDPVTGAITFFENGGPFYDGECSEDPNDVCGDLEQGVENFYQIPTTLTVPCVDGDGDGLVDIGSCLSWDNGRSDGSNNKPSCLTVRDAVPNTKAKCKCETLNIANVYVAGKIIVDKETIPSPPPAGFDDLFDFTIAGGPDGILQEFQLKDGDTPHDSGTLTPSFLADPDATYSVTEGSVPTGWTYVGVTCTSDNATPDDPLDEIDDTLDDFVVADPTAINLGSGETVTCVFENAKDNERPVCVPELTASADCNQVTLSGSATDAFGGELSYLWTTDCAGDFDDATAGDTVFTVDDFDWCGPLICTFTFTASDDGTPPLSCEVTTDVTLEDAELPVLAGVPDDLSLECDQPLPPAPVVTASDNCGDPTVTMMEEDTRGGVCAGVGTVVRTWTATDDCGNDASATQTITFVDTTNPVLSGVPADAALECDQDIPAATVTATDNCDATPTVTETILSDTRGDVCAGVGVVVREWTATDCSGNSASATQTVTFSDNTNPVLSGVPADAALECDQDLPVATVTATDNCDADPTVTETIDSDTRGDVCAGVGQVVRTWTATDCTGNSVSASQTVTFSDNTNPVLSGVPADAALECDQDLPVATVTATDNCDADPTVSMTIDSDTRGDVCAGVGQVVRTWTATDCTGNSASATQTVTFSDNTNPVLSGVPADAALECDQDLPVATVTATDNCDADPTVSMTIDSDTRGDVCAGVGQVVRTWTATDCTGNSVSASQTVTFSDNTNPVLSGVPADAALECDQDLPVATVTATDNCDADPTVSMTIDSDTRGDVCAGVGQVVRTWTATDCTGNSASASQTVTFSDNTNPVLSGVPADAALECDQDLPVATVTATDNCDADPTVSMTIDSDTRGDVCAGVGQVVRTWTATDCTGNSVSASQTVTFSDNTNPVLSGVPADAALECDQDLPVATVTATDNCDADPTVSMTIDSDTRGDVCAGVGQVVRTWTATDCTGNSASATQTVTFSDNTNPVLSGVPADAALECDQDLPVATVTATDNCDADPTVSMTIDSDTRGDVCAGVGQVVRTWTATDCTGNSVSASQTVTFSDNTNPVLSGVPADAALECDQDLPVATVTATDNCDADPTVSMTIDSDTRGDVCAGVGQVVRTWTATDCTGNSASATQTVTFSDNTNPVLSGVPADAALECDQDLPVATVTATDNCDADPTVSMTIDSDTRGDVCAGVGQVVRTWTATDCTGNSVSASQTVTFSDNTNPVLSGVPADAALECDQDLPVATVTATDNCDADPTVSMTIDSDTRGDVCAGVGQVVRTWTATDCTGNSASATQTVTFSDNTNPVLSGVPADAALECDQDLPVATVTATDNCDADPTVSMTIDSDTRGDVCAGVGQVVRTWTATDCTGNSVSASQTVTFSDNTNPVLSGVPADAALECDQDLPVATVTATDNCDADPTVSMTIDSDTRGDVCAGVGQVVRTWTATDCSGNSVSAQQTVTFVDRTAPIITPPADVTVGCYEDRSPTNTGTAFASDNCELESLFFSDVGDPPVCGPPAPIIRTWTATDCAGNSNTGDQTITVDCPCGTVELTKYTQGVLNDEGNPTTMPWSFTLEGPGIGTITNVSPPSLVEFGDPDLLPTVGSNVNEYTLCEADIFAGWTTQWKGDPNPDATTPGDGMNLEIIDHVFMVNNDPVVNPPGYSRIYDPNYVSGSYNSNDTKCVNFIVLPGETEVFEINNMYPGGDPRTIGYWKNWNTCTNGNQANTAFELGGPTAGVFILDDILNDPGITIGMLQLDGEDCEDAVSLLDKRDIRNGKKMARDAAYNLASQLLAAVLNLSAGAETCTEVTDAVTAAQELLVLISFDGEGRYLRSRDTEYGPANELAATLDEYNNGALCEPLPLVEIGRP